MKNSSIRDKHSPIFILRFKQIVWVTIFLVGAGVINTSFFSYKAAIVLSIDVVIMLLLFSLIRVNRVEWAKQIYLWINLLAISYVLWSTGGLANSSLLLSYPLFLMIVALIGGSKTFFSIYFFAVIVVTSLGVMTINNWYTVPVPTFGYWQVIIVILLLSASSFMAWRFNNDMKHALKKLKAEVLNVKKSRSEIERLIHFDPLTGLASRLDCEQEYLALRDNLDETQSHITVFYLDIDNFKSINDYYNHSTGDELLKKIADRLLGLVQENDIACRLSGDEFILIISRPKKYNLEQFSQRILQRISKPVNIFDDKIEVTISIGIAISQQSDESFEDIQKRADLAMYRAKQSGKNKYSFYDEEIHLQSLKKIMIVNGLKTALKCDDLDLFLQPKVDILTGKIHSAEALIRWSGNNFENVLPSEFIPLIESTELICNIGEWVIRRACLLCKEWHDNGFDNLSISVNISSAQFVRGGLEKIIIKELQRSQLPPQFLELELTEHVLFQEDGDVLDELKRIKDLGITLSIDDFGTGYSNLGYLTRLRVDSLKIDRSFIKGIDNSPEHFEIVTAIIKIAKTLGLKIIAEGVENKKESKILEDLGCDYGQGFLWSEPLSSKEFLNHVSDIA